MYILSYPKVANHASGAATSTLLKQKWCGQHGLHGWEDEMSLFVWNWISCTVSILDLQIQGALQARRKSASRGTGGDETQHKIKPTWIF